MPRIRKVLLQTLKPQGSRPAGSLFAAEIYLGLCRPPKQDRGNAYGQARAAADAETQATDIEGSPWPACWRWIARPRSRRDLLAHSAAYRGWQGKAEGQQLGRAGQHVGSLAANGAPPRWATGRVGRSRSR